MSGERLLLVDDEDNLRSMLEAALRHERFEVHTVGTGREALDAAGELLPDVIVLDVMLPDLDGFEVCRRLRAKGTGAPIVFLTARDGVTDTVRGLTLGGDDYLVKPFSLEELVARINAVLRRSGLTKSEAVLRCADLEMDDEAHIVRRVGTRDRTVAHRVQASAVSLAQSGPRRVEAADPRLRVAVRLRR